MTKKSRITRYSNQTIIRYSEEAGTIQEAEKNSKKKPIIASEINNSIGSLK
jgi:hypothetical protein